LFSTAFSIRQTELRIFAVQRKEFLKDHIQALILGARDTALIYILNPSFYRGEVDIKKHHGRKIHQVSHSGLTINNATAG